MDIDENIQVLIPLNSPNNQSDSSTIPNSNSARTVYLFIHFGNNFQKFQIYLTHNKQIYLNKTKIKKEISTIQSVNLPVKSQFNKRACVKFVQDPNKYILYLHDTVLIIII